MSSASQFKIVHEGEFEREVGEEEFEYEEYSLEINRKSRIRVALTDSGHGFGVSKTFQIRRKDERNKQYVSRSDDEIEKMRNDIAYRNKFEVILNGQGETWCELAVNDAGFNDTRSYSNQA